jgi:redox-sensitive bicupin YhaK (pirin superfamily)
MQAGGGVWHGGAVPAGGIRGFQLWVALAPPLELAPPESHYVDAATIPTDGNMRVLLGSYGAMKSPIPYPAPVTYLHVRLADGERWIFRPHAGHDVAWLAVSTGALRTAGVRIGREMVVFARGDQPIEITADGDVELVIASAVQHPHPLVTGRYSVHTSRKHLVIGETGIEEVARNMPLVPWRPLREAPLVRHPTSRVD